jgi:hypothetical protein
VEGDAIGDLRPGDVLAGELDRSLVEVVAVDDDLG